jgi:hypothetical protein
MYLQSVQPLTRGQQPSETGLRIGQVVKVAVLEVQGGEALVKINNEVLRARFETMPPKGTELYALVENIAPGLLKLKRVETNPRTEKSLPLPLEGILGKTVPEMDLVKQIIQEMMSRKLPLSREAILQLLEELLQMPERERKAFLQAGVWAQTLDMEENKQNIAAVVSYLTSSEREVSEAVRAQKLINQAETKIPGEQNLFCFSLEMENISGRVYLYSDRPKQEGLALDNVHLVVQLTSASLGELWFQIVLKNKHLSGVISTENENNKKFLESNLELFTEALGALGYTVGTFRLEVKPVGTVVQLLEAALFPYRALDIKV